MKPQSYAQPQRDNQNGLGTRRLLEADPDYAAWSAQGHAAEAMTFDAWLDTEEGKAWLDGEAELYDGDASFGWPWESSSNAPQ